VVESTVVVNLSSGLHARPAATFVQMVNRYSSEVHLIKEGKTVNAKSILGVMSLAVTKGCEITVRADGSDEQKAIDELTEFLNRAES
jgi:catabolite repression HPr-like protein